MNTAPTSGLNLQRLRKRITVAALAVALVLLVAAIVVHDGSKGLSFMLLSYAGTIGSVPIWLMILAIIVKAGRTQLADAKRDYAALVAYFEAQIARADAQLQALSIRIGGSYRRGELEWARFAPAGLVAAADEPPPSIWGQGSWLRFTTCRWRVEVTFGVEPLGVMAWRAPRYVLVPRVTVTPEQPMATRLDRFDADWAIDRSSVERLASRAAALARRRERMSPAAATAHVTLREASSTIRCFADRVEAIGRPVPGPAVLQYYGHSDFELASLIDLVERTLAFTRAIAEG